MRCILIKLLCLLLILNGCHHSSFEESCSPTVQQEINSLPAPRPYRKIKQKLIPPIPAALQKPVTVTFTEDLPLKEVLLELASQTGANIAMAPDITERVVFFCSSAAFSRRDKTDHSSCEATLPFNG